MWVVLLLGLQDTTGAGGIAGAARTTGGQPAPFVTVCVTGTTRCDLTDERGAFRIGDIRAGTITLEIAAPGLPPITSDPFSVRAGVDTQVDLIVPELDLQQTIQVTATRVTVPDEVKTSAFLVRPEEILTSAGALQDVSRFVQSLPGAAIGTNDFRNDLIVRGGSPLENLFIVDNVEIPNINTFANFASAGGTVSILDAALIEDVTFLTGGYPASYTNRASSVLQITQREGSRERLAARATVGFAGAGGIAEGPLGGGRGSWVVSARRSFIDLFTDDAGLGGVPVLYTLNGKAVYDLGPADRVWVVNVTGIDRIRLGLTDSTDFEETGLGEFDIRYQGSRSATGVNWQRVFSRGVGLFGLTHSTARVTSRVKDLVRDGVPPPDLPVDQVIARGAVVFDEASGEDETTVKYDVTLTVPGLDTVQAGGSVKRFRLGYDAASPFGSDSPYSARRDVGAFAIDEAFTTWQTGAYVQATTRIAPRLEVTWGARVDRYDYIDATRVSPRLSGRVPLTGTLSWTVSYGHYHQQPFFLFLAAFPGNRSIEPFRADHHVTGLAWQPDDGMRVTLEAYRKEYRDYPVAADLPQLSLANVGDTFNVREILFPLVSEGRGRAEGVELFAERKPGGRWFGQANVAVSRVRHAGRDGVLRPGSFDYPVVVNVVGSWRVNERWLASARLAYLGGRPVTPFDLAASAAQRRGIFDLTRVNAERAPDYFRLDVRAERAFTVDGRPLTVFAGVQNVTNRRNFASYSWNRRENRPRLNEQLGLFPILGLEWRF